MIEFITYYITLDFLLYYATPFMAVLAAIYVWMIIEDIRSKKK